MSRSLDLRVVTEGVETEAQRRWLEEEPCPWAQGYLFRRPEPPDEVGLRLAEEVPVAREAG